MNQRPNYRDQTLSKTDASIHVRGGNLYLKSFLYEKFFPGIESAILMKKDEALSILPVANAYAGGLLLKILNAQGDRVIHAQEFFRHHGLDEQLDQHVPVAWDATSSALMVQMPLSAYRRG